jgi:uncharacterized protein DUF4436
VARVGVVLAVVGIYALSLLGYHLLANTSRPLPPPELGTVDDTDVVINLVSLDTVNNRLEVEVSVYPDRGGEDSTMDDRLNVLTTDIAVQLYPPTDFDDLHYAKGKTPAAVITHVAVSGDVNRWPFDSYATQPISAVVVAGSGDDLEVVPARVEVTGTLNGWHASTRTTGERHEVAIALARAKGPLVFGLGICLVIVSLPAMALFVSIEILRAKHKFMPAYAGWYTAMLFALVPLRNVLPGAPPPGAWIDQAIVVWALFALVAAMILFIIAWNRQDE